MPKRTLILGTVAFMRPRIKRREALAVLAGSKPSDMVLLRKPSKNKIGWYACSVDVLTKEITAEKDEDDEDFVSINDLIADVTRRRHMAKIVSPLSAKLKLFEAAGATYALGNITAKLDTKKTLKVNLNAAGTAIMASDLSLNIGGKKWGVNKYSVGSVTTAHKKAGKVPVYMRLGQADQTKSSVKVVVLESQARDFDVSAKAAKPNIPQGKRRVNYGPGHVFDRDVPHSAFETFGKLVAKAGAPRKEPEAAGAPPSRKRSDMSRGGGDGAGPGGGGGKRPFKGGPNLAGGSPPPESITAYPEIIPESLHVLQEISLPIAVQMNLEKSADTTGAAQIPAGRHDLDVHVLLGEHDAWGKLQFDSILGTIKAAKVELKTPLIPGAQPPERWRVPIIANFYLNNRWCGEGRRTIEVLLHDKVTPSSGPMKPEASLVEELLHLEPGAEPPDLLVRIQETPGDSYQFTLVSPHLNFTPGGKPDWAKVGDQAYRFVRSKFEKLAGRILDDDQINEIKDRLRAVYDRTPEAFKDAYWTLRKKAQTATSRAGLAPRLSTIQFISDEAFVPWDLMMVSDAREKGEEILAIRHAVGRWTARGSSQISPRIAIKDIAVFASDYSDWTGPVADKVPMITWTLDERKLLTEKYGALAKKLTKAEVIAFLEKGGAQSVHFACHGKMNVEAPEDAALWMTDTKDFTTAVLGRPKVREGLGAERPLIFLNACQVGAAGADLSLVTGWPQRFVNIGAVACIAPLWSVGDANAHKVAEIFYQKAFRECLPLGEVLQHIRSLWERERSLTHLSYTLYGDPNAKVTWSPKPSPA